MATEEAIIENEYFILLDVTNTVSEYEIAKDYPIVQIVDPSSKNSYQNIKAIQSIIGSALMLKEKRKNLFTINLNVGFGYKTTQFKYDLE
ncbi:MAG: hypothetical protein MUO34_09585 [Ignavibacteriaceae bacterium]|nr:hypothetical protein [Ignavibacteriaceae bacterium]